MTASQASARRGTSLIEVLVAIAIVAILLGLILSAVVRCRGAAHRLSCQNNLANFGKATGNYLSVHKTYPVFEWPTALFPYIEVPEARAPDATPVTLSRLFVCPADRIALVPSRTPCGSYGFNAKLMDGLTTDNITDGTTTTIQMAEAEAARLKQELPEGPELAGLDLGHTAHPGGGNVLFADGSVRFLRSEQCPPELLQALLTPRGGEVVVVPE